MKLKLKAGSTRLSLMYRNYFALVLAYADITALQRVFHYADRAQKAARTWDGISTTIPLLDQRSHVILQHTINCADSSSVQFGATQHAECAVAACHLNKVQLVYKSHEPSKQGASNGSLAQPLSGGSGAHCLCQHSVWCFQGMPRRMATVQQ